VDGALRYLTVPRTAFCVLGFLSSAACLAATATDDRGVTVYLPQPARRIIAISPHLAELAFDAGAGNRLVAAVRGTDYPPAAAALPAVGDAAGLDFERIAQLRPDLVLAWGSGNRDADIERLGDMAIAVFVAEPRRLEDIARHLRAIGALAGTAEAAGSRARDFERRLALLRSRYAGAPPRTVFVEIWRRPLFTVGPRHLVSDALGVCAGRNAVERLKAEAVAVPLEWVLRRDPDAIVSTLGEPAGRALQAWSAYPRLKAVAAGAIHSQPPEALVRATPRILDGVESVCAVLDRLRF
jgi:iron complex transport system substrate-binding protein